MRNKILTAVCIILLNITNVFAQTDSELLQQKLAKFSSLDSDFSQQVINPQGQVIQESVGKLIISRPGSFYWKVTSPEEELIVSNGIDMWLFSPFIEQVTIMKFSDAIAGTPFALLSGAEASEWQNFSVKQSEQKFVVKNIKNEINSNQFVFSFDKDDNISEFSVEEVQGQKSIFKLSNSKEASNLANDFFEFQIPQGIEIDDQR